MNLPVACDSVLDNNKPSLQTSKCTAYMMLIMPLGFCRHSVNSRHSRGCLISHKAEENYQSESKFDSVAVIMKGQISPSIDSSPSSSSPSSTSVCLPCFHILFMCWIIDQPPEHDSYSPMHSDTSIVVGTSDLLHYPSPYSNQNHPNRPAYSNP